MIVMARSGAFSDRMIKDMIKAGMVIGGDPSLVSPASLDLRISDTVYRINDTFLPRPGEMVADALKQVLGSDLESARHQLPAPLERGVTYLAKLQESFNLPWTAYCYVNPKSTSGRNNLQVRVIADGVPRFDAPVPANDRVRGHRDLWIVMQPKSYPVRVWPGEALTQARFFDADTRFSEAQLEIALASAGLIFNKNEQKMLKEDLKVTDSDGSVTLTLDLSAEVVGWECLGQNTILDFSKRNHYNPEDFFRPLIAKGGLVRLKQFGFYILSTKERVRVPPWLACEMVEMSHRNGEFRSHFAGYIDAGWGWGKEGEGIGRSLVCEVIPYEDLVWYDGQPLAQIRFEKMLEEPSAGAYDVLPKSSYAKDFTIPRLSKHFKMP